MDKFDWWFIQWWLPIGWLFSNCTNQSHLFPHWQSSNTDQCRVLVNPREGGRRNLFVLQIKHSRVLEIALTSLAWGLLRSQGVSQSTWQSSVVHSTFWCSAVCSLQRTMYTWVSLWDPSMCNFSTGLFYIYLLLWNRLFPNVSNCCPAKHWQVHTVHCTLNTAHCTLNTAHCILHMVLYTLHTAHWTLSTLNTAQLNNTHRIQHNLGCPWNNYRTFVGLDRPRV